MNSAKRPLRIVGANSDQAGPSGSFSANTAATNGQGKVTSGWTLNGVNQNLCGKYLYGERIGYDKMYQCPAGSYFTGIAPHVFENTVLPGVQVTYNGTSFDLPNTPVSAPVA